MSYTKCDKCGGVLIVRYTPDWNHAYRGWYIGCYQCGNIPNFPTRYKTEKDAEQALEKMKI